MQGATRGARPADGTCSPSATARSLLQGSDLGPGTTIWDQVFPVITWRSVLGGLDVTLSVTGSGTLYGATPGRRHDLGALRDESRSLRLMDLCVDWLWVEGDVDSVAWSVDTPLDLPGVTVVMPTYRREADAITQAERFLSMPLVRDLVVVDQGGTLKAHAGFTRLRAGSENLRLVTQPNLGGSGGYARGMLEAARRPENAVLFSDDDAVMSEESLRRMLTFQTLAARPTIVGSPLFSSVRPSLLMAHTEAVHARAFQWRATDLVHGPADLAGTAPEEWGFLSQDSRANYSGWWGTLFPPGALAELGLPLPLFLKWDDAEYGLRATERGFAHAVLPGTGVHHPPWSPHRTQMSWTARVLHRNRLAVAAAYGARRGVLASSILHQCKHVLAGHLLTAELWEEGIDAFRQGPDSWLGTDLPHARADGTAVVSNWHRKNDLADPPAPTHASPRPLVLGLAHSLWRLLTPDSPARIVLSVPADLVHWRTTLGADLVRIEPENGSTPLAYSVRGSAMRRMLRRTVASHLSMARCWGALRARYRDALPAHTTAGSWSALLGDSEDASPNART